jgi:hypothetical protein
MFHQEYCIHNSPNNQTYEENKTIFLDFKMLNNMGAD